MNTKKKEVGLQIKLEVDGSNIIDLTAVVGRLMGQLYANLPPFLGGVFRSACQAVAADDSPVWKPEEGIKIDLAALKRQRGEQ